jgi:hypothetical protein
MYMLTARKGMMHMTSNGQVDTYVCVCGHESPLTYKDVTTKFENAFITVTNVPVYECPLNHVKMARLTRIKIKQLLKEAYASGQNKIPFG